MPDVAENKPFSAYQLLLQNRTLPKRPLFHGIPSSTLTHVDSELYESRRQRPSQPSPPASSRQPIPQRRVRVPLAERYVDVDPTFPNEFSRTPVRITKQIEKLNYGWGPLLRCLGNIRYEVDGLRSMVVSVKRNIEKDLKIIMLCFAESNYIALASRSHAVPSVPSCSNAYDKGNLGFNPTLSFA